MLDKHMYFHMYMCPDTPYIIHMIQWIPDDIQVTFIIVIVLCACHAPLLLYYVLVMHLSYYIMCLSCTSLIKGVVQLF